MTDRLSELAKALADASDRLNGTNHRDDQRLMEEVATRIQARVDDYDAAYAALEAYGLEKASEGAVKVEIATNEMMTEIIGDHEPSPASSQSLRANGWDRDIWQVAEPQPVPNGLDAHNEE